MPWPNSSHHGQGPRPTAAKRYGIGGFRGMNPMPQSSQTEDKDHKVTTVNKNRDLLNSNRNFKNTPLGNRLKRVNDNIGSMQQNVSMDIETEIQQDIEGKSKAWQYLEKWQHKTNPSRDSFKSEMDKDRLRSSGQNAHSREVSSARKDDMNTNRNRMIFNKRNAFPAQHSSSHTHLNSKDVSFMHERLQLQQQGIKREFPSRHSSNNQNSPVTLNNNMNLSKYGLSSSNEGISASLKNRISRDPPSLQRNSGNNNHRSLSPARRNVRYQSVKEAEHENRYNLLGSYSPEREGLPDREFSRNRDHSPENETKFYSKGQPLVQHTSRHTLHHHSSNSERQHSRYSNYSPEIDISPPRQLSPELNIHYQIQTSERHHSSRRRYSPDFDVSPSRAQSPEPSIQYHNSTSEREHSRYRQYSPEVDVSLSRIQSLERRLRHQSPTSDGNHSRYRRHSLEFDISPPREQSPEPRLFLRKRSPSQEIFRSTYDSPPRDFERTKSHSFARSQASMKVYEDMLLHDDLPKNGRSPTRQHQPEHLRMRDLPKEYNSRAFKHDRSVSPTSYRVKPSLTRGRSQERILENKFHRRLSPNEEEFKRASLSVGNMPSRRLRVSSRSPDQHSVELSRLSPHSFLQNMNALHKEYSPVLMDHEENDGYRSRERSQTSSLERQFLNKRYRGEDQHKTRAKTDDRLERYKDSRILEKDSYSRQRPISERLGGVIESDSDEEIFTNISLQEENEDKEDLRNELLRIKEQKVEEKLRIIEEKERDTNIKLRILEKERLRKDHEDSTARRMNNSNNSQNSRINHFSNSEDIQPRNSKSLMMRKVYSDDISSEKYHSGRSTDTSHFPKRELTSASVRQPAKTSHDSLRIHKRKVMTASSKQSTGTTLHPQKRGQLRASSVKRSTNASLPPQKRKHTTSSSLKRSADVSIHPKRREPITAISVKQSSSLVQKKIILTSKQQNTHKDSSPLKEPKAFSPVRW